MGPLCAGRPRGRSAEQLVVVGMSANPEPHQPIRGFYCEHPMVAANPRRPEAPNLLEVERRMTWILFETLVGLICTLLDVLWQGPIARPERRGCVVNQRGLVLPVVWS